MVKQRQETLDSLRHQVAGLLGGLTVMALVWLATS